MTTTQCGDAYLTEINAAGRGIVLMHDSSSSANGNTLAMVKQASLTPARRPTVERPP